MSNLGLLIQKAKAVDDLLVKHAFTYTPDGERYALDDIVMPYLHCAEDVPEGYRQVAVHIVPYTVQDDEIIYYAFNSVGKPTIYMSFLIRQEDFTAYKKGEVNMSFCQTLVGKIVRTFDQPKIDMKLDTSTFKFPAVIDGEFIWSVEVTGDDHHAVDEMVKQLGNVIGRVTNGQIAGDDIPVNELSVKIAKYVASK